jgi:predicted membrane-bound spermidine synthase
MFFLSGAGALAFEAVWFSQAALVVGNSVWSAALVVGAFMAGLALGTLLAAALARRWRDLVLGYARVEVVAALSGLALVFAFPHLPALIAPLLAPWLGVDVLLEPARLAIAFVLLAVPATALGATLPLLAKPLEAASGNFGFALGRLYGLNTLGAVAGVLLAELVLIPQLGLRGSGIAAACCNLGAAAIAWRIAPRLPATPPARAPFAGARLLGAAFLAGATLLALEVVGFRYLLLFLDGTTLVFAVMLAVALGGIALGGLLAAARARRGALGAGAARAAAAVAVAAVSVALGYALCGTFAEHAAPGSAALAVLASACVMGPAALASGFLFTALGALLRERIGDAAAATAALTCANTLGAMLGSLLAAFVLLPALGLERSFFLLALAYGVLIVAIPSPRRRWAPALAALAAVLLFPFGTMQRAVHPGIEARFGAQLVATREGAAQSTFYLRHDFLGEPLYLRLATNSYSMASTAVGVQRYMKLFAWLPAALHPRIEDALLLCYGVGSTARALADLPEVKSIDVVDVSSGVLEMADVVFPEASRNPLRDARVRAQVEDARFFLQHTPRRYDLITGEPPPPKMAGVAPLYTREYFELLRARLKPGGLATYWLPAYLLLEKESLAVIGAFCGAFEDCSLWSGLNRDWILLGSNGGVAPVSRAHFARLWAMEEIGPELQRLGIDSPAQLAGQFMADARSLRELASGVPPLLDDHPRRIASALYAEASTPRYAELMDAERARKRLEASRWSTLLPPSVVAASGEGFRRRAILEAAFNPELRRADYNGWADLAYLVRETDLVEVPRWLMGSGASVARIAAQKGPSDPVALEHMVIDAAANRRAPVAPGQAAFQSMTPRAQSVIAFHHCVAGQGERAWTMMGWMQARDPALFAWAGSQCPPRR